MLTSLRLRDFRCFEALACEVAPGLNFFIGPNAQGKTSLLEAICVGLRLASPRSTLLGPLVRHDQPAFAVRLQHGRTQLDFRYGAAEKSIALDGVQQGNANDYLQVGRLVYFGNTDLELVRGRGEIRRRYLDFLGAQMEPLYRTHLRAYERALRSRNRLLKQYPLPRREIAAWDGPLLESGAMLTALRASLVQELAPAAARAQMAIGLGRDATLDLAYLPGAGPDFAAVLAASAEQERRTGVTSVGPHRDDVSLLLDGRAAAEFASEGQQRTLALALKLAQAEMLRVAHGQPILLLDDIFGELDPERRNALFAALPAAAQKFLTTTHLDWLEGPPGGPVWTVHEGRLSTA
ncbi:MAG: DNA replication/repair protein RecF [Verrucomicrobia bacterium]|nr:DNA replication/repair protein RecF [Verrucomicrobiota bacterium]